MFSVVYKLMRGVNIVKLVLDVLSIVQNSLVKQSASRIYSRAFLSIGYLN